MASGDYKIQDIYLGGYSSLDSNYGNLFTGYRAMTSKLGSSTDARTANIIKQVSDHIAPGQRVVELSLIQPEILDAIPKQHLKEVNRIAKLTGTEVTVHGPLIDASGISRNGFEEAQREIAERKIFSAVERSHEINPDGNIPVTFHTANALPGARWNKEGKEEFIEFMPVVNQETGQISMVKREEKFYPGIGKEIRPAEKEVGTLNNTTWLNDLTKVEEYRREAEKRITNVLPDLAPIIENYEKGKRIEIDEKQKIALEQLDRAGIFVENIGATVNSLYNRAYKYLPHEKQKELANEIQKIWKEGANKIKKEGNQFNQHILYAELYGNATDKIREVTQNAPPQVFKPAEEYALEKSKETFGNVAWQAYKKFGDKAPIINIENPPAGFGLSRAEDLKKMIEGAREKFVENAMKNGMGKNTAEKEAEKLIGATWDVGHINQLRQFGFSGKDIIGEAKKIAPLVKHIHLSDNFGMENTELPMGMGNVDFKEVMKVLGEKGENARKITEAFHWWQHHSDQGKISPVGINLEALGSPIYSMHQGPYWNQSSGFSQPYFGGYGQFLPSINYETFGGGFSNLPSELGGQRQQRGSRMGGTPME